MQILVSRLIGASILAKGTTSGTISDFDGTYTLDVPDGTTTSDFLLSRDIPHHRKSRSGLNTTVDVTLISGYRIGGNSRNRAMERKRPRRSQVQFAHVGAEDFNQGNVKRRYPTTAG